jgi:molecular chaperone GrpE
MSQPDEQPPGTPQPAAHDPPAVAGPEPDAADAVHASERAAPATAVGDTDDRLLRAVADLANARKRHAQELARERLTERARVASLWLPVVDNLDRALEHANPDDDIVEGIRQVREQALAVLASLGYPRRGQDEEVGQRFDPARHEVVGVVDHADLEPNRVVAVLRPGYGTGEHQLRPSAVVVSRRQE